MRVMRYADCHHVPPIGLIGWCQTGISEAVNIFQNICATYTIQIYYSSTTILHYNIYLTCKLKVFLPFILMSEFELAFSLQSIKITVILGKDSTKSKILINYEILNNNNNKKQYNFFPICTELVFTVF